VRITGIRVDGYGVFSGLEIEDLPPGLTVVVGANEAGKSTLLDFLRGVLFGFPDRRSRSAYHEPLRGGRHGGAVRLADGEGRRYVVERHLDSHGLEVFGPDGSPLDERRLTALLGGADESLYRSVFAFGLGELAAFESLDRDEIRDLVFSAGVLGAGRSATRAGRALEQRRATIVRPRRQDALANTLQRRLEELDSRLRQARHAAQSYPALRANCERLVEEASAARASADALDKRSRTLDQITLCWPIYLERRASVERLRTLPPLEDAERALVCEEIEVRRLVAAASGHEERLGRFGDLAAQLAGIEDKLAAVRSGLGLDDASPLPRPDVTFESKARALRNEHAELLAARPALEDQLLEARAELRDAIETATAAGAGSAVRTDRELAELAVALNELRRLLRDRDEARLAALATTAGARPRTSPGFVLSPAAFGAVALLVLAAVLSTFGSNGGSRVLSAVLGGLAAATLLVIALAARAARSSSRRSSPPTRDGREEAREATISASALRLGIEGYPTAAALETCGERLELERAVRRRIDEAERHVVVARRRHTAATERAERHLARIVALEEQSRALGGSLGLGELSPEGLLDALGLLSAGEEYATARVRVRKGMRSLSEELAGFERALGEVEIRATGAAAPESVGATERVRLLEAGLDEALRHATQRAELEESILAAETFLANSLGSGAHGEALREELERADVLAWEQERERIDELAREATLCNETARDELHDAERTLRELTGSDEIASLELEREAVARALDRALSDWLALGLARAFLDRTLARYERERQPRVISLAGELFQEVTDGRYVALVARDSGDTGKHHGIDAIGRSGERVPAGDLSRGTAEQLYLCLRLAFAATFAEQATSLPLVLDDVLVNFDPARSAAMARVIARVAESHQVLAFTCHPHVADRFADASAGLRLVELSPVAGLVGA